MSTNRRTPTGHALKIGLKLKLLRGTTGLSQEAFGLNVGIPGPNQSMYESGRTIPYVTTLARVARYYNVELKYFFED